MCIPSSKCSYDLFFGCAEEEERAYYLETQAARKQQKKLKGRGKMKKRGQDKVCVCVWGGTVLISDISSRSSVRLWRCGRQEECRCHTSASQRTVTQKTSDDWHHNLSCFFHYTPACTVLECPIKLTYSELSLRLYYHRRCMSAIMEYKPHGRTPSSHSSPQHAFTQQHSITNQHVSGGISYPLGQWL